ncbi:MULTISPECIES: hypothetical protein [unclassified Burkholderia]|uniref:hypothetical protein n=1 Tax=unclassified Burkholderia TaxID=2613784 RepID=UPI00158EDF48|nr:MULTISPECIES: hypothetical protein [unclassified Burkholderia]
MKSTSTEFGYGNDIIRSKSLFGPRHFYKESHGNKNRYPISNQESFSAPFFVEPFGAAMRPLSHVRAVSRAKCNTSRVTEQERDPWG